MTYNKVAYYFAKFIKKIYIPVIKNSVIHKASNVCSASQVVGCKVDRYSFIGNNCTVLNCSIGAFCSIADFCIIGGSEHPMDFVSSSPAFLQGRNCMSANFSEHPFQAGRKTQIGNDVWIGSGCLIKAGVCIGDGAVIGMGSVVTKDVPPYTIVVGNPAREIRKRFDESTIKELLSLAWWEWDDKKLRQYAPYFTDVEQLLLAEKEERL